MEALCTGLCLQGGSDGFLVIPGDTIVLGGVPRWGAPVMPLETRGGVGETYLLGAAGVCASAMMDRMSTLERNKSDMTFK